MPLKKKIAKVLRFAGRASGYISFYCHDIAHLLDPEYLGQRMREMAQKIMVPDKKDTN